MMIPQRFVSIPQVLLCCIKTVKHPSTRPLSDVHHSYLKEKRIWDVTISQGRRDVYANVIGMNFILNIT